MLRIRGFRGILVLGLYKDIKGKLLGLIGVRACLFLWVWLAFRIEGLLCLEFYGLGFGLFEVLGFRDWIA